MVSHELRTPVSAIRGSLGIILGTMKNQIPDQVQGLLTTAYSNCERLITLINDLLDVDKTIAGQMDMDIKPEPLNALLKIAADNNQPYAEKYKVTIECITLEQDIILSTDRERLIQILSNFLSNAAKFSLAGSVVRLTANVINNTHVRISVTDYGIGIPKEFQEKIFEKFSQADSSASRKISGTGLGLYITKSLVEALGGTIGFKSIQGYETTFWIEFPVAVKGPQHDNIK